MHNPKRYKICKCDEPRLSPITGFQCANCKDFLVKPDDIEKLYNAVKSYTEGHPNRHQEGNLCVAARASVIESHPREDATANDATSNKSAASTALWNRRPFLMVTLSGLIYTILADIVNKISKPVQITLGLSESHQKTWDEAKEKTDSLILAENDIRNAETTLLKKGVLSLREQAEQYRHEQKYAMSMLFDALADHAIGIQSRDADNYLTKFLDANPCPAVQSRLYFHRGRARVFCGNTEQGLNDLDAAIDLAPEKDPKSRLEFLRQAMSHAYISIERENVLESSKWNRLHSKLDKASSIIGLQSINIDDFSERQKRALDFDPVLGIGTLIFEALMRAVEYRSDIKMRKRALEWHYNLIRILEQSHPILGWIRYTPLAAQAITLGELKFAEMVLTHARDYALSKNTVSPVVRYARSQRENKAVEWLFHEVVFAALHLAKHEHDRARTHLKEPLHSNNNTKCLTFARAAKLYEMETFPVNDSRRIYASAGASNVPARTHWAYFPNLPKF